MWQKARFFADDVTARELMIYPMEPKEAKRLGREVKGYNDTLWSTVRYGFMVYVNYLKYTQHESLRKQLLETKDLILVECNPRDKIWGIGLDEKDPRADDPKTWDGQNLLGKALMKVRDMIRKEEDKAQTKLFESFIYMNGSGNPY
jgi:ribA/ribD-fused uncharacterized protein